MIDWIGFHLIEENLTNMMTLIFVCQYINTAFLLVLASLQIYPDYTEEWYLAVGKELQQTMLFQAFMPYLNFAYMYLFKSALRLLDSH